MYGDSLVRVILYSFKPGGRGGYQPFLTQIKYNKNNLYAIMLLKYYNWKNTMGNIHEV